RVLWLGVAFGLAFLTKLTVVPLILPALWVLWIRRPDPIRRLLGDLLKLSAIVLALAGPFYLYRWIAYGDPLATAAWAAMLPPDSHWKLTDLFWFNHPFRYYLWTSFWGVYGWQAVYLPDWIYNALLGLTVLAIAGGAGLLWRRALNAIQQAGVAVLLAV